MGVKLRVGQIKDLYDILYNLKEITKHLKPSVDNISDLPTDDNTHGDIRLCISDNNLYIWNNPTSSWDCKTSGNISGDGNGLDPANFYNKEQIDAKFNEIPNHTNLEILEKISQDDNGDITFDGKPLFIDSTILELYMSKADFISATNPTNVKKSDSSLEIEGIKLAEALTYYGKDSNGVIGFHPISNQSTVNIESLTDSDIDNMFT